MLNTNRVIELKEQLAVAEQDAKPVIVEKTEDNADQTVYLNHTSGTKRVDLKGGEPMRYEDRPVPTEEVHYFDKPLDKAVGTVVRQDEKQREITLTSGTKRVDIR